VEALLDAGVYDMQEYLRGDWLTGLLYECELEDKLKALTGGRGAGGCLCVGGEVLASPAHLPHLSAAAASPCWTMRGAEA
jgi:hypothetical protein